MRGVRSPLTNLESKNEFGYDQEALLLSARDAKPLAKLYRQWVEALDASAAADLFRFIPWSVKEMTQSLAAFAVSETALGTRGL